MLNLKQIREAAGGLDNLTDEEILQATYPKYKAYYPSLDEYAGAMGYGGAGRGQWGSRFSAAIDSYQAGLLGVGEAAGLDWGRARERNEAASEYARQRAQEQGAITSYKDIGGVGDAFNYVGGLAVDSSPYLAEAAVGALTGGLGMGATATRLGLTRAGARTAGAVAAGYPSAVGDILQNQREQADTTDLGSAALGGVSYAALNAFGVEGGIARGFRPMASALDAGRGVRAGLGRAALTGVQTGIAEGVSETGQEFINQWGRNQVDPTAGYFGDDALNRYGESFVGGGLLGGTIGAGAGGWRRSAEWQQAEHARMLQAAREAEANKTKNLLDPNTSGPAVDTRKYGEQGELFGSADMFPVDNSDYSAPRPTFEELMAEKTKIRAESVELIRQKKLVQDWLPNTDTWNETGGAWDTAASQLNRRMMELAGRDAEINALLDQYYTRDLAAGDTQRTLGLQQDRGVQIEGSDFWLTDRPFDPISQQPAPNIFGDLTPDWTTSPGAGVSSSGGLDPSGMYRAVGEPDPLFASSRRGSAPGSQIPTIDLPPMVADKFGVVGVTPQQGDALYGETSGDLGLIEARKRYEALLQKKPASSGSAEALPLGSKVQKEIYASAVAARDAGEISAEGYGRVIDSLRTGKTQPAARILKQEMNAEAGRKEVAAAQAQQPAKSTAKNVVVGQPAAPVGNQLLTQESTNVSVPATPGIGTGGSGTAGGPVAQGSVALTGSDVVAAVQQPAATSGVGTGDRAPAPVATTPAEGGTPAVTAKTAVLGGQIDFELLSDALKGRARMLKAVRLYLGVDDEGNRLDERRTMTAAAAEADLGKNSHSQLSKTLKDLGVTSELRDKFWASDRTANAQEDAPVVEPERRPTGLVEEARDDDGDREPTDAEQGRGVVSSPGGSQGKIEAPKQNLGSTKWYQDAADRGLDKISDKDLIDVAVKAVRYVNDPSSNAAVAAIMVAVKARQYKPGFNDAFNRAYDRAFDGTSVAEAEAIEQQRDRNDGGGSDEETVPGQAGGTDGAVGDEVATGEDARQPESRQASAVQVTVKKRRTIQKSKQARASSGEYHNVESLEDSLLKFMNADSLGKRVFIVGASSDLETMQDFEAYNDEDAVAWARDGKAYLIADRIRIGEERGVFLHEVGGHLGLERLLGEDQFKRLSRQIVKWAIEDGATDQKNVLARKARDRMQSAGPQYEDQMSELVAYFIEEAVNAGVNPTAIKYDTELGRWLRTVWAAFKAALRKLGIKIDTLTPQDVVDLAYGAARLHIKGRWHGSAANIHQFRTKYVGTGEGAQAYGWGLYFSESRGIAKSYAESDARRKQKGGVFKLGDGSNIYEPELIRRLANYLVNDEFPADWKKVVAEIKADTESRLERSTKSVRINYASDLEHILDEIAEIEKHGLVYVKKEGPAGQLYAADFAIADDEWLDWSKPFAEQSPKFQEIIKTLDVIPEGGASRDYTGQYIYTKLEDRAKALVDEIGRDQFNDRDDVGAPEVVSKYLDKLGIKGVKVPAYYTSGGSNLSNYVVFNEKNVIRVANNPADVTKKSVQYAKVHNQLLDWVKQAFARKAKAAVAPITLPNDVMKVAGMHRPVVTTISEILHINRAHPDIRPEDIASLPDLLSRPRVISQRPDGSYRFVLDARSADGRPMVVGLMPDKIGNDKVFMLKTIYPHDSSAMSILDEVSQGRVVYASDEGVARLQELLPAGTIPAQGAGGPAPTAPLNSRAMNSVLTQKAVDKFRAGDASWRQEKIDLVATNADVSRVRGVKFSKRAASMTPAESQADLRSVPEALRPTVRKLGAILQRAGRKSLNAAVFTEDLLKRAAKMGMPSAETYLNLAHERQVFTGQHERKVLDVVQGFNDLPRETREAANKFLYDSTIGEKWGYQPTWLKDSVEIDPATKAAYDALGRDGQRFVDEVFRLGNETLAAKKDIVVKAANTQYDALIANAENEDEKAKLEAEKAKTLKTMFGSLMRISGNKPYAPIKRFGDHVVIAKSQAYIAAEEQEDRAAMRKMEADPDHYYVDFAESENDAMDIRDKLRESGKFKQVINRERELAREELYGGSQTLRALMNIRQKLDLLPDDDPEVTRKTRRLLTDLYLIQLAEDSARKSEIRRRRIAGDIDMIRSLETQGQADARFLGGIKYAEPMLESINGMRRQVRATDDQLAKSELLNEIIARHLQALDWKPTPLADFATKMSSLWFLATSPAYYLQNATQPWTMSLPVMAADHDYGEASAVLTRAYRDLADAFKDSGIGQFDFQTMLAPGTPGLKADEKAMIRALLNANRIDIGMATELGQGTATARGGVRGTWHKIDNTLRNLQLKMEALNRLTTALAAYRLAQAKGQDGVAYANDIIQRTHGDYSAWNAPRVFNTGFGKVALQFRKFQLIQLTLLARLLKDSFKGATPEERAIARKAFRNLFLQAFLVGGAKALPIFAPMGWLLAKAFGDDADEPPEYVLRKMIGDKDIADMLINGVPSKLSGVDFANLVGMSKTLQILPFTDINLADRQSVMEGVGAIVSGPFGGLMMRSADAIKYFENGNFLRGIEMTMPKGAASILRAYRVQTEGVTQQDGDVTMSPEEIRYFDTLQQAFGFTPQAQSDRMERQRASFQITEAIKNEGTQIKAAYAKAIKQRDTASAAEARAEWQAYQDKRARFGFKRQPLQDLVKAPAEQAKRERSTVGNVQYTPATHDFVRQLAGER